MLRVKSFWEDRQTVPTGYWIAVGTRGFRKGLALPRGPLPGPVGMDQPESSRWLMRCSFKSYNSVGEFSDTLVVAAAGGRRVLKPFDY